MQAARRLSRAAHAERCHWPDGCNNNVGVTAGKASHNTSNARDVTAGKMGRNSSRGLQIIANNSTPTNEFI